MQFKVISWENLLFLKKLIQMVLDCHPIRALSVSMPNNANDHILKDTGCKEFPLTLLNLSAVGKDADIAAHELSRP